MLKHSTKVTYIIIAIVYNTILIDAAQAFKKIASTPPSPLKNAYTPEKKIFSEKVYASVDMHLANTAHVGNNAELLNDTSTYDRYLFAQTIADSNLFIHTEKQDFGVDVDAKATIRLNTVLGNASETTKSTPQHIKIGRALTESYHEHAFNKPIFWLREGSLTIHSSWLDSFLQMGLFSKKIGLGLVLGDRYEMDKIIATNPKESQIDQFRPGILTHAQISKRLGVDAYIGLNTIKSVTFNSQAEMTNGQEISGNQAPYHRTSPHHAPHLQDYIVSLEFPYDLSLSENKTFRLTPFVLYHNSNLESIEFYHDASSATCTVGATLAIEQNKFQANFDVGFNFGHQKVKQWDRNESQQHASIIQTHVFAKNYTLIADPSQDISITAQQSAYWNPSSVFGWPEEHDISLYFDNGVEYSDNNPNLIASGYSQVVQNEPFDMNHHFKNSFTKYRKAYTNELNGWMVAADMSYQFNHEWKLGAICGYASGDSNPNDGYEKPFLYRLDETWDNVRKDYNKTYKGFKGTQSLYYSKNVPSMFMLVARKLNQPLSSTGMLTTPEFSNMTYGGIGLHFTRTFSNNTKLYLNPNFLFFATPHQEEFGYDPSLFELYSCYIINPTSDPSVTPNPIYQNRFANHNKLLSKALGFECNMQAQIHIKDNLLCHAQIGVFVPGGYYDDIKKYSDKQLGKHIPLKNQYELYRLDRAGAENLDIFNVRLSNNVCWYANLGITFEFDSLFSTQRFVKKIK